MIVVWMSQTDETDFFAMNERGNIWTCIRHRRKSVNDSDGFVWKRYDSCLASARFIEIEGQHIILSKGDLGFPVSLCQKAMSPCDMLKRERMGHTDEQEGYFDHQDFGRFLQ